ncbi:MAG: peptidoglycan recognition family protein [Acidobacteriota bacterium]
MSVIYLSREQWGADPAHPRRGYRIGPARRTAVFIHHTTAIDRGDASPNTWESLDEVRAQLQALQIARPDLGLDVPYNFVAFCMADGDLVIGEGRGEGRTAAHARGFNRSALGIALAGNFDRLPLPEQLDSQLAALGGWLAELRRSRGFEQLGTSRPDPETARQVFGHRDVKSTQCPGDHLWRRLGLIRFLEDPTWRAPGDAVNTAGDEERVFAAYDGDLKPSAFAAGTRRALAVMLDRQLQLEARLAALEKRREDEPPG